MHACVHVSYKIVHCGEWDWCIVDLMELTRYGPNMQYLKN